MLSISVIKRRQSDDGQQSYAFSFYDMSDKPDFKRTNFTKTAQL